MSDQKDDDIVVEVDLTEDKMLNLLCDLCDQEKITEEVYHLLTGTYLETLGFIDIDEVKEALGD